MTVKCRVNGGSLDEDDDDAGDGAEQELIKAVGNRGMLRQE